MNILVVKTTKDAITPALAFPSDIGYDLTAISIYKEKENDTILYETGIKVKPPHGYYFEIVPRSSISGSGYMLANSVGIIDPHYTGSLKIALIKVRDNADTLIMPFCICQLVLKKAYRSVITVVDTIEDTDRGDGGFGSTNFKIGDLVQNCSDKSVGTVHSFDNGSINVQKNNKIENYHFNQLRLY